MLLLFAMQITCSPRAFCWLDSSVVLLVDARDLRRRYGLLDHPMTGEFFALVFAVFGFFAKAAFLGTEGCSSWFEELILFTLDRVNETFSLSPKLGLLSKDWSTTPVSWSALMWLLSVFAMLDGLKTNFLFWKP